MSQKASSFPFKSSLLFHAYAHVPFYPGLQETRILPLCIFFEYRPETRHGSTGLQLPSLDSFLLLSSTEPESSLLIFQTRKAPLFLFSLLEHMCNRMKQHLLLLNYRFYQKFLDLFSLEKEVREEIFGKALFYTPPLKITQSGQWALGPRTASQQAGKWPENLSSWGLGEDVSFKKGQ